MHSPEERAELLAAIPRLMQGPVAPVPIDTHKVWRVANVIPFRPRQAREA